MSIYLWYTDRLADGLTAGYSAVDPVLHPAEAVPLIQRLSHAGGLQ